MCTIKSWPRMGNGASKIDHRDVRNTTENTSDELRPCETCEKYVNVFSCNKCKNITCKNCCEHSVNENKFYMSNLTPVSVDTSSVKADEAVKLIRCGIIGRQKYFVIIANGNLSSYVILINEEDRINYITNFELGGVFFGDACFVKDQNKLFLTAPNLKMVYSFVECRICTKDFGTPLGACYGITHFNNGLALTIKTSEKFSKSFWQIQYLDFNGNVLRRIQTNPKGKSYFGEPLSLASNKNGDTLFVSDRKKGAVFAFDVNGNLVYVYSSWTMRSQLDIVVDKFDNVYVACGKKAVQIKKGGEKSRDLDLNIKKDVVSLCIDDSSDRLTVISMYGDKISFDFDK